MKIFPIFFLLLISVVSFAEDNAFEKADSESKIIKAPAAEKLRVEARGCETAQTHCYQGFRDKKNRWIINLCENIKRYKKGIYTFDSKGLRFFKLSEDDFKISCNDINYEFKADINKRGEIERINLDFF